MREEGAAAIPGYAGIPIAFEVRSVFDVVPRRPGAGAADAFDLVERAVAAPWVKDYDYFAGEGPLAWATRFDLSRWGVLVARRAGRPVGGAVVAWRTPGVDMLEGREDLAVLWDIRVAPEARGQGIGSALLHAAEEWARARGGRELKVETQNVNVPACRFYGRHAFVLRAADVRAYPGLPGETQLLWYKDLGAPVDREGCSVPRMVVFEGDITSLDVDAIVNAANGSLLGGGGVDGAIHGAAGPGLLAECRKLDGCGTGRAKMTGGHGLRARHVIHAVGPVYEGGGSGEAALLRSCYVEALRLAEEAGLGTIAFPCISTGIFGYPKEEACGIAVAAVEEWLASHDLPETVLFCCYGEEDAALYHARVGA